MVVFDELCFLHGRFLARHKKNGKIGNLPLAILFFVGFVFSSVIYAKMESTFTHSFFKIMAALCFAGLVRFAYALVPLCVGYSFIHEIGKSSLYIYILHVQALTFLERHGMTSYAALLLSLAVVLAASMLLEKMFALKNG